MSAFERVHIKMSYLNIAVISLLLYTTGPVAIRSRVGLYVVNELNHRSKSQSRIAIKGCSKGRSFDSHGRV